MKNIKKDLLKLKNKWVALKPDKKNDIIASAKSVKELQNKLIKLKVKDASIMFVTPPDQFLAPVCH